MARRDYAVLPFAKPSDETIGRFEWKDATTGGVDAGWKRSMESLDGVPFVSQ